MSHIWVITETKVENVEKYKNDPIRLQELITRYPELIKNPKIFENNENFIQILYVNFDDVFQVVVNSKKAKKVIEQVSLSDLLSDLIEAYSWT